jgi:hypothetical protein
VHVAQLVAYSDMALAPTKRGALSSTLLGADAMQAGCDDHRELPYSSHQAECTDMKSHKLGLGSHQQYCRVANSCIPCHTFHNGPKILESTQEYAIQGPLEFSAKKWVVIPTTSDPILRMYNILLGCGYNSKY